MTRQSAQERWRGGEGPPAGGGVPRRTHHPPPFVGVGHELNGASQVPVGTDTTEKGMHGAPDVATAMVAHVALTVTGGPGVGREGGDRLMHKERI